MKLNQVEKRTFFLLVLAAFFNGFIFSSFQIQDIIAKKALHAYDWQITILVMLWPISNLLSIWWGKILEHSKSLSKFFVLTAFVGRLSLIFMLWVHNYYQYLVILIVIFSFSAFSFVNSKREVLQESKEFMNLRKRPLVKPLPADKEKLKKQNSYNNN